MQISMTHHNFRLGLNIAVRLMNHCGFGEIAEHYRTTPQIAQKLAQNTLRSIGSYLAVNFCYNLSDHIYNEEVFVHDTLRDVLNHMAYRSIADPSECPFWERLDITPYNDMPAEIVDNILSSFHGAPCFADGKNYVTFSLSPRENTFLARYQRIRAEAEHLSERYTMTETVEFNDEIFIRCVHRENPRKVLFITLGGIRDVPSRILTNCVYLTHPDYNYCSCDTDFSTIYIPPNI